MAKQRTIRATKTRRAAKTKTAPPTTAQLETRVRRLETEAAGILVASRVLAKAGPIAGDPWPALSAEQKETTTQLREARGALAERRQAEERVAVEEAKRVRLVAVDPQEAAQQRALAGPTPEEREFQQRLKEARARW